MATVFLNGRFVSADEALVTAFDAGFQHGLGLFETMLALRDGGSRARVVHLREHINRLAESCRELGLTEHLRVAALEEAVERTCAKAFESQSEMDRLRVRLTITGGDLNLLTRRAGEGRAGEGHTMTPTLLIVAQPATQYPRELFESGATALIADWRANPLDGFQGHKTLNYWPRLRELQKAAAKRAGEAIVLSVTNHLVGGCVSNVFVVKDGAIRTPIARGEEAHVGTEPEAREDDDRYSVGGLVGARGVLPSPVLPGIVRRWVMDWAESAGVEVRRRMISVAELLDADEVFLTNTSWGVMPVVQMEGKRIAGGTVGELSRRLIEAWESQSTSA